MTYFGRFAPGDNLDIMFTTTGSTGAPVTLSAGSVACYVSGSTGENTSAITLTTDFDSRTGLHNVRVATSAASTFYISGSMYHLVITAGSVQGVPVNGYLVGSFDLRVLTDIASLVGWSASQADATANPYSLYSMIMGLYESDVSGSTWTVYRSDHSTTHMTRALTLASAGSIVTGVT